MANLKGAQIEIDAEDDVEENEMTVAPKVIAAIGPIDGSLGVATWLPVYCLIAGHGEEPENQEVVQEEEHDLYKPLE